MSNKKFEKTSRSKVPLAKNNDTNIGSKSTKLKDTINLTSNGYEKISSGKIIHPEESEVHNESLSVEDIIQRKKEKKLKRKKKV